MKDELSPVYLDGNAVDLLGDEARPRLSRIVQSVGKRPDRFDVRWLASPFDAKGLTLGRDEVIDRTLEPTKAIYLRSEPHLAKLAGTDPGNASTHVEPDKAPKAPDAVIAQLGGARDRTAPESDTRLSDDAADLPSVPVKPILFRDAKREAMQEAAEAEAEQRQEGQRNEEGIVQDEGEAFAESEEDAAQSP